MQHDNFLCYGQIDKEGHARSILKSPSGETMMVDFMNPNRHQEHHPCINSIDLNPNKYQQLKDGQYIGSITMSQCEYELGSK